MVVRWPPWVAPSSRKIEATILVRRLEGVSEKSLAVEIKWKGQKGRRSVRRNCTKDGVFGDDGVVGWDEEFRTLCNFLGNKEGLFPWEVVFTVYNGLNRGPGSKACLVGTASLNLAEFALTAETKELQVNIPLVIPAGTEECSPLLCLSLSLLEVRSARQSPETLQRCMLPILPSPCYAAPTVEKDGPSALKAGLRKAKIFRDYVSARRAKKASHEEESSDGVRSEDAEWTYRADEESLEDDADGDSEESNEVSTVQQSLSYETLAKAKCVGGSLHLSTSTSTEDEEFVYYSNREKDVQLYPEDSVVIQSLKQSSKRRILSWRKRKLGFRILKAKGEPLLNKDNGEGGDDIDFFRRQISSSDESSYGWNKSEEGSTTSRSSVSEFGDGIFAIGSWEEKDIVSRDGQMKLRTQVFYASIDQRSERAAGESACTALVAVISNWLLCNKEEMPIKSELDSLIRDGSLEWRKLCGHETYKERFPDKHFDLDTIIQAKIRPLSVLPDKSFIGFFHPEGLEGFEFLEGAMSFDNIWDEISSIADCQVSNGAPLVYIVSWNDHFFVLRVESDAYYIIDTLGERLSEGCEQAYILKFDRDTRICGDNANEEGDGCRGKECCKEYMKSFLAAIPIRELQADMKKGLREASTPLHHRLQIEFHYTQVEV